MAPTHPLENERRDDPTSVAVREAVDRVRVGMNDRERELWALVAITCFVDLGLTLYGFRLGLVENNQLAHYLLVSYGYAGIIGLKLFALALALVLRRFVPTGYGGIVPLSLAIPWAVAVLSNTILIASTF